MKRDLIDLSGLPRPTGAGPNGDVPSVDPAEDEDVSPEEQGQYEQFVTRALQFIHGPKSRDAVIDHLNQPDLSVPEAVGRTSAFVVMRVNELAKAGGAKLSPDVVFHAGQEIVEELMEVGARAKILPIEWPEEDSEEAMSPETIQLVEQAFAIGAHEYGKHFVQTEEGQAVAGEAGDFYARQVAKEADAGTLHPDFGQQASPREVGPRRDTPVAQGVRRALVQE